MSLNVLQLELSLFVLRTSLSHSLIVFSQLLITDPTEDEEKLCSSLLTMVFNENDLCFVHKSGGIPISQNLLCKSMSKAKNHVEQVKKLILVAASTKKSIENSS